MNFFPRSVFVLALAASALAANAQITQIPLFSGTLNEGFEGYTTSTFAFEPNPFSIMGGAASLASTDAVVSGGNVFFLGDKGYAQPSGGSYFYGSNAASSPSTITFANPVGQFGGYFNVDVNAAAGQTSNLLTFTFLDAFGAQIGASQAVTMSATNVDAFVGFASTVPFKSVRLDGFYFVADDLRANILPTPEPATFCALGLGAAAMLRRRKRA